MRTSWIGPLVMVVMRSALLLVTQGVLALFMSAGHREHPLRAAGDWWNVYGSVIDVSCLLALNYLCKKEGLRVRDLIGSFRLKRGRDLLIGFGYFLIIFPCFLGGAYGSRTLLYSSTGENPNALLMHTHPLPVWATVYSLSVWWLLWSPTEETTYQGYVLPRLQALTGRTWIAFLVVGFFWSAQHCALPLIPDWRFALYRFLSFVPGVLALMIAYWRKRRLPPVIIAHWPMDLAAAIASALY